MMQFRFLLLILIYHPASYADALQFEDPVTVTSAAKGVFLHLDGSGRRSLGVLDGLAAVVWEDNRSGHPAAYVAFRQSGEPGFSKPQKFSDQLPAYEPVISAVTKKRFIVAWEEGGYTWLRVVSPSKMGEVVKVGQKNSQQVSVAIDRNSANDINAGAVWSQGHSHGHNREYHIYYAGLSVNGYRIRILQSHPVDNSNDKNVQLYPVIEYAKNSSIVVWEDRRQGATRIFSAYAPDKKSFESYRLMNEFAPSPNPELGKGSGAMRPVLSGNGKQLIVAAWMDKRNWRSGYDVFAAVSTNGGQSFAKNEQAQDMFGDNVPQWHASIASNVNADVAAVAWDDTRNETSDVLYSLRMNENWSEDFELPGATGDGRQSHPSIVFDDEGVLHAVWLNHTNGQAKLQYTHSKN